jgi:hypothetical protein
MYNNLGLEHKKYISKLRFHSKFYRKKIEINNELIQNKWIEIIRENPNAIAELGAFRHFNHYCNYDYVRDLVVLKWEEKDPVFSRDIIHSVQNYTNTSLLKEIMLVDREYREYKNNRNNESKKQVNY